MSTRLRLLSQDNNDAGIGVITVIMVIAVLSAFLVTATTMTVNNLGSTNRDRHALSALSTSEAGVAQAVQMLRSGNLGALTCIEPAASQTPGSTCTGAGPSWTSSTNPKTVVLDGGACATSGNCFKAWIGTVQPYVPNCAGRHALPPTACYGVYRVHSTGLSGGGPSGRKLAVDVKVTPYPFPIGVFADTLSGNGNVGVHGESIFTNGCMMNRQDDRNSGSGVQFTWDSANNRPAIDLIYDQPIAAHATGNISTSNTSCGADSKNGGGFPIHQTDNKNPTPVACNPTFRYDQDGEGAPLVPGDGCYGAYTRSDGTKYPTTSLFTQADLQNYGYRPRGLTDAQYDALKAQAQSQGTYNIDPTDVSTTLTGLVAAGITSPVLYWDNGSVSIKDSQFPASFKRALSAVNTCASNSVTIVVSGPGHDLTYQGGNSGPYLVASIFVPDGSFVGSSGNNTIGTLFAKKIDMGGNMDFYMDQCFASNPPGATLDAQVIQWREDDGTDLN